MEKTNVTGQWVSVKKGGFPKLSQEVAADTNMRKRVYCTFISGYIGGAYVGYLEYERTDGAVLADRKLAPEDYTPYKWVSTKVGGSITCLPNEALAWFIMPKSPTLEDVDGDDGICFRLVDDLTDDAAEVKLPE